jgi:hypothetical protein
MGRTTALAPRSSYRGVSFIRLGLRDSLRQGSWLVGQDLSLQVAELQAEFWR